jgi:hypothetical protein
LSNRIDFDELTIWTNNGNIGMIRVIYLPARQALVATVFPFLLTIENLCQSEGSELLTHPVGPMEKIGMREMVG